MASSFIYITVMHSGKEKGAISLYVKCNSIKDELDIPLAKEYQYQFAMDHNQKNAVDYYIFGHRHKPMDVPIGEKARLINLGDWVNKFTYAVLEKGNVTLHTYNH